MADNARFRIRIVVDNEFAGETGRDGVFEAKGETNCGEAVFFLGGNSGFYDTPRIRVPFDSREGRPTALSRWWKPDNPVIAVALQPVKPADGLKIRCVREEPAGRRVARVSGVQQVFERKGGDWYADGFSDKNTDRAYAFRIRSRRNENGELVEAYYGKIYGDFEFEGNDRRGLVSVKFLYYLNPTPLDRNLEWDIRNNLCPDPGSLGERRP